MNDARDHGTADLETMQLLAFEAMTVDARRALGHFG